MVPATTVVAGLSYFGDRTRSRAMTEISGVWLPVVTPYIDGAVDFAS